MLKKHKFGDITVLCVVDVLNEGAAERLLLDDGRTIVTLNVGEKAAATVRVTALGTPADITLSEITAQAKDFDLVVVHTSVPSFKSARKDEAPHVTWALVRTVPCFGSSTNPLPCR